MPGRFPLYTDADIHGPLVEALVREGWNVLRAIDRFPEGTEDDVRFDEAVRLGRVLVANDSDMKALAERRLGEGRRFPRPVVVAAQAIPSMTVAGIVQRFEDLAPLAHPFGVYPIVYIKPY